MPVALRGLALVGLLLGLCPGAASAAGYCESGKTITFAGIDWDSGAFLTEVMKTILAKGYGCKVDSVPGNTMLLEQAIADDEVQIMVEEWVGRSDVWNRAAAAGKVLAIGDTFKGAEDGWFVPTYLIQGDPARHIAPLAPDLHSVEQLTDKKYVTLFQDPEEPGKGRFLNCPSGYTCEAVGTAKLEGYGLTDAYTNFRPGTGAALDGEITSAYLRGAPILFAYWSPSSIVGRFKLTKLDEPPWNEACWKSLTSVRAEHKTACGYPPAKVSYGVSAPFAQAAPEIIEVLEKATFPLDEVNRSLSRLAETHASPAAMAADFIKNRVEIWRPFVSEEAYRRIIGRQAEIFPDFLVFSIREPVNRFIDDVVTRYGGIFRSIAGVLLNLILWVEIALHAIPWWALILGLMALAAWGTRRAGLPIAVGILMLGIGVLGLWDAMVQTLALMLLATLISVALGIPIGILIAKRTLARTLILPTLDVMQTMPSFVYLLPVLMLFGLGKVPAVLATVIYAVPPLIRLTELGIRQVDHEVAEAARAFGATERQLLFGVELPLALPSIMAGINQTIMMALSMVVVASMIGARGLGEQVLSGIQTLDFGKGLEGGIGIVILAIVADRITQALGRRQAEAMRRG
jgi:ABC-type proline/glycine betaine transport system permease subunit/ABC-type proline/glycine betaine transport system substrate-binding protein